MTDIGLQYGAVRERVTALVADLSEEQAATPVPACPGWTVHDLVAHLSGAAVDIVGGNLDGVGSPPWTAAQVDARRDVPIPELLATWAEVSPQLEDGLRAFGGLLASLGVADAWNHEQDLRGALGAPGGADPAAEHTAIVGYGTLAGNAFTAAGVAPLRVEAGDVSFVTGEGDPGATVIGSPYELARAVSGRRTGPQLHALTWEGDAEPYIRVLADMGPTEALPC